MVYLDILIGFSLVMLVFASAVSVAQTVVKGLCAVKGSALKKTRVDEIERAWRESPRLMAMGPEAWTTMRGGITASMKSRRRGMGKALRRVAVRDGYTMLRLLRDEGLRMMDGRDARERAEWEALVVKLGNGWDTLAPRLAQS